MKPIYNKFTLEFTEEEENALTTVINMLDDFYEEATKAELCFIEKEINVSVCELTHSLSYIKALKFKG